MSGERDALMVSAKPPLSTYFTEDNQLSYEEREESYDVGGGKLSYHGVLYQLRLIMFFILKCLANNISFSVATEMKDAGKFDDLILRTNRKSGSGGFLYRLIQAQHKGGETTINITTQALLKRCGHFSLRGYFQSYLELRYNFTSGQDDIRDLVICTNGRFKSNDSFGDITIGRAFEETEDEDEIFKGKLLRFGAEGRRITKDFLRTSIRGITHCEEDIDCFLDKLRFATDEYDTYDLEKQNKSLIKRICCFSNIELAYPAFEKKINDWLMSSEGIYLSAQTAQKFLKSLGDQIFNFRAPVTNFIGREQELKEMDGVLKKDSNNVVVISGLAGIGKSELARKFIQDNSSFFKRIVWIPADSLGLLITTFRRLADRLRINVKEKQTKNLVKEIYTFFENKDSVFVFDNVEISDTYTKENLKDFLPNNSNRPFLILTSRVQLNLENSTNILLDEIEQDDAENFIKSNLPASFQSREESIKVLAKLLHNYPLAIQQAVAYIKYEHKISILFGGTYGIDDYLKMFKEEASKILSFTNLSSNEADYDKTTMIAFITTFKQVEKIDDRAEKILNILSHFAPDNIDTKNILLYFEETNRDKVKRSLKLLKKFSVLELKGNKINIHKIGQNIKLLKLKEKGEDKEILRLILKSVLDIDLEHKMSVWQKLDGYEQLQLEYAHLPLHIMESLVKSSRYEQSYLYGKKAVNELKKVCEPTDPNLLKAMERFAYTARCLTHDEEASTEYEDILKRVIEEVCEYNTTSHIVHKHTEQNNVHTGDGKPDISSLKFGISNCYLKSGNITDALNMFAVVYEMADFEKEKEILMKNVQVISKAIKGIVKCHSILGDKKQTLMLYAEVYEMERVIFGENDEKTLLTNHEIAMCHLELRDKNKALLLLAEVYYKERKFLGEDHVNTINTKHELQTNDENGKIKSLLSLIAYRETLLETLGENSESTLNINHEIAMYYSDLGNKTNALTLLEEVSVKLKEKLGENHESTLVTEHQIAMHYSDLGDKRKALSLLEGVYQKRKDKHGENHESTLDTKYEIAMCHDALGDKSKALMFLNEVHEKARESLGENNGITLSSKYQIAMVYSALGDKTKALKLFSEVHEQEIEIFGEDHERTLLTKYQIARCHSNLSEKKKALTSLEDVYNRQRLALGETHESTLLTRYQIAKHYSESGDRNNALKIFEYVYEKERKIKGEDHERTLTTGNAIAICHLHLGHNNEALSLLERVYEKRRDVLGENHESTLVTKRALAICHSHLGRKTEALRLLEDVYERGRQAHGENHPMTKATLKQIKKIKSTL